MKYKPYDIGKYRLFDKDLEFDPEPQDWIDAFEKFMGEVNEDSPLMQKRLKLLQQQKTLLREGINKKHQDYLPDDDVEACEDELING